MVEVLVVVMLEYCIVALTNPQVSWLLRFFRSDFFDVWVAVAYLYRYPEHGIRDYLCNELFKFPVASVEFYLPQLAYVQYWIGIRHTPMFVI